MSTLRYTRNLFLRCFCIVYLFAFLSFYIQIPGLYGDSGILPAKSVLENTKHKTWFTKVHYQPTLLWLTPYLGLDTNYALDFLALLGSFLAFTGFISQKFCTIPLFAGLWSVYFSLYQVGQVFISNNYDEFLLEAGFLALLMAPLLPARRKSVKVSTKDAICFWLVRWLLFRFLFTSGITKYTSGCPKWWNLSAFTHYFETQPLPSPLAWYFHQIPVWYLKLFQVIVALCEVGLPLLFFVPMRNVSVTVFVVEIIMQIFVVLSGNFNFANLLIVTLLLSLLDDNFFYGKRQPTTKWDIMQKVIHFIVIVAIGIGLYKLFDLKINGTIVESQIAFSKDQLELVLKHAYTYIVYFAAVSLTMTIVIKAFYTAMNNQKSTGSKIANSLTNILYTAMGAAIFLAGTVPIATLHSASNSTVPANVRQVYNRLHKLHAVNEYGLFSKVQGIDGRSEIVLEGADNIEGPWLEYSFLYKPGNVNNSLPFIAPHSPRLDWQMYWAAYSTYEKQPWILSLTHRLLNGNRKVRQLIDSHHSPFSQQPPKYIRAILYKYKFTQKSQSNQNAWWTRQKVGEYFPAYTKDSPALVDYLKARNLLAAQPSPVNPIWKQVLDSVRFVTQRLEATLLLWSVFTAGCAIITTSAKNH